MAEEIRPWNTQQRCGPNRS